MLKKTISYTDYDGNQRTEDFYFNLSKAEITEMELSMEGGMRAYIQRIIAARSGQLCILAVGAVQQVFHSLHLGRSQHGAVKLHHGSILVAGHVHGHGVALPAEGLGIRAVVHGLVALLTGLCGSVPHHMDDIALVGIFVGAHLGLPAEAEGLGGQNLWQEQNGMWTAPASSMPVFPTVWCTAVKRHIPEKAKVLLNIRVCDDA